MGTGRKFDPQSEEDLTVYLDQCWKWRIPRTRRDLRPDISYYLKIHGRENKFENGEPSELFVYSDKKGIAVIDPIFPRVKISFKLYYTQFF